MADNRVPICKCGAKLKRIYSRSTQTGFNALDLFYCEDCKEVYQVQIGKKLLKKLSPKDSQEFLKRKEALN